MPTARPRLSWLLPGLIVVLTALVFLPTLQGNFLSWDDLYKFRDNPDYRGLGWKQLRWMWTTGYTGLYQPVAWMTWGADYLLWGLRPAGYRLTSLLAHLAAVLAVYGVARRLLVISLPPGADEDPGPWYAGAALAALFFGLHPLRVEPVAWISARGDVLAGLFVVLAVLAYLAAWRSPRPASYRRWLAAAVLLFTLSLLAKPTGALMLPLVLVVLDVYPLGRLGGGPGRWLGPAAQRVWAEKLPFLVVGLVVTGIAFRVKGATGSMLPVERFDPLVGLAKALFGAAFYVGKTFLLGPLSPLYERPPHLDPFAWPFVASGLVVLGVTVVLLACRRRWPAGLAAWVAYLLLLAPSSGLFPYGSQLVASRYSYVSCLPWAILVGSGIPALVRAGWTARVTPAVRLAAMGVVLAIVAGLGVVTWRQIQVWEDSETLWTFTLLVTPRSAVPHVELGILLERRGEQEAAARHFREAAAIWPGAAVDHVALGRMFVREGRFAAASAHFRQALAAAPGRATVRLALAHSLAGEGKLEDAARELEEAIRQAPQRADARVMLGSVLAARGRWPEAIESYRGALRLDPDSPAAHYHLAVALAEQGDLRQAADEYRTVLRLAPGFPEAGARLEALRKRLRGA
jgi:tetratricopeptide (TPR) repeat protein